MALNLPKATRRELHSSRSITSVVVAVIVIALCVYALLECVLKLTNQPAWLLDPQDGLKHLSELPQGLPPVALGIAGAVAVVLGLIFLVKALGRGTLARHQLSNDRLGVVVDDEVLASALARKARTVAGVTAEQITVTVGQRSVDVHIRPTSGIAVDGATVEQSVQDLVESYALVPEPRVRVRVSSTGAVGV